MHFLVLIFLKPLCWHIIFFVPFGCSYSRISCITKKVVTKNFVIKESFCGYGIERVKRVI